MFPSEYSSSDFVLPQLITIVDETVRCGIDVCEGAIGWRSIESETEVLHLYSTATKLKEIAFYPTASCDATYCVDPYNPSRYINVDSIFDKAHEERLAELEEIAFALGAKAYTIEIAEIKQENNTLNHSAGLGGKVSGIGKLSIHAENTQTNTIAKKRIGTVSSVLEGHDSPQRPKLKWFADHENIKILIDKRCNAPNSVKVRNLKISGSSSATMTHKVAAAIDGFKGLKGNFSMQNQVCFEHSSELIFSIEF